MGKESYTDRNRQILKEFEESRKNYISLLVENNIDLVDRAVEKFYLGDINDVNDFRHECYIVLYEAVDKWLGFSKEFKSFRQYLGNTLNHWGEGVVEKYLDTAKEVDSGLDFCIEVFTLDEDLNTDWVKDNLKYDLKNVCTDTEFKVLNLRYGLSDGEMRTLEEVAKILGITREKARQWEARGLRELRSNSKFKEKYKGVLW